MPSRAILLNFIIHSNPGRLSDRKADGCHSSEVAASGLLGSRVVWGEGGTIGGMGAGPILGRPKRASGCLRRTPFRDIGPVTPQGSRPDEETGDGPGSPTRCN